MKLKNYNTIFSRHGFGMIEIIVSLAIIIMALTSIVTLVVVNLSGQKLTEDQIIASNLTREGIEAFRSLRDSSLLAGSDIQAGIELNGFSPGDHSAIMTFDTSPIRWTYNFGVDSMSNADLYISSGVYSHDSSGTITRFRRLLSIDPICSEECNSGPSPFEQVCFEGASCDDVIVGYRVQATTEWDSKGGTRNHTLVNYLYNWK